MVGESRSELLNWVNDLLQLDITKVEQCGTGAVYCQIMDSIYQDLPISRVKFELNGSEYQYLSNFKILQSAFLRHKISKPIPVERLIKCKFQDNLEFLQWIKKFWMENKDESEYDAQGRRNGIRGTVLKPVNDQRRVSATPRVSSLSGVKSRPVSNRTPITSSRTPSITTTQVKSLNQDLLKLNKELQESRDSYNELIQEFNQDKLEKDFYFKKLREIEILTLSVEDLIKTGNNTITLNALISQLKELLYATEEGFQTPGMDDDLETNTEMILDEETF